MTEPEFQIGQRVHVAKDDEVYVVVGIDGVFETGEGPKPYRLALEDTVIGNVILILAGQSTEHIRPAVS